MKRAAAIIAIFLLVCGCAVAERKPASDGLLANDDEKLLWQQAQAEQKALNDSALIYRDNQLEAYLNSVVRRLQPPDLPSRLSFKIVVVRDPYFNAFAFPNGVIYIHTGMLARMDNEAQLAALLAHEIFIAIPSEPTGGLKTTRGLWHPSRAAWHAWQWSGSLPDYWV
jgi:predicted Zn-dependent protease